MVPGWDQGVNEVTRSKPGPAPTAGEARPRGCKAWRTPNPKCRTRAVRAQRRKALRPPRHQPGAQCLGAQGRKAHVAPCRTACAVSVTACTLYSPVGVGVRTQMNARTRTRHDGRRTAPPLRTCSLAPPRSSHFCATTHSRILTSHASRCAPSLARPSCGQNGGVLAGASAVREAASAASLSRDKSVGASGRCARSVCLTHSSRLW